MSKFVGLTRAAAAAVVTLGMLAASPVLAGPPAPPANASVPAPKIVVVDRNRLLNGSKVAQDIARQGQAYIAAIRHDLKPDADQLQKDFQAYQTQAAILSADVKARKMKDFQNRQAGLQQKAFKRQAQIRYGVFLAQKEIEKQLDPILTQLMNERGANLLFDRAAIIKGTGGSLDITQAAIDRLDQKMPSYKVQLTDPPPDVLRQMMAQAQQGGGQ
ncbi:MAG TPA: OmpH family outer membrane protein [Rhizomicrobium sp.]|jgi:hypothetical protein